MSADGVGAKSIRNYIGTLSALYRYAMHPRRRWATSNPCDMIDLPPLAIPWPDARFNAKTQGRSPVR